MQPDNAFYVGLGLALASAVAYWLCRRSGKRLDTILETPTIACKDLPGLGASTVEVVGAAQAQPPLLADLTRTPCVAFSATITEHWTTTETVSDGKGGTRTVTRSHSAVRYSNEQRIPFDVIDATGAARVEPDGAEIELLGMDAGPAPPDSPAFGVSAAHWNGRLTYAESALPVSAQVYVLAQVSDRHTLVRPATLNEPFIISPRSEAQLVRSARWGERIWGFLAIAAFVAGMGMLGYWYEGTAGRFPWQAGKKGTGVIFRR